ncbi:ATP-binding cassette domain-containing protein [Bradyrhizobium sp. DOA9]|uniref:ATP-binding cassette domain-containing protein n=1 Tax=Bradyrhizobium sp. DOA9 TaxID=1126627 RepID=UPI000A925C91|nr:ATP-binding cassette domain-containing protein [Bradyrhizobium sp. DOA9]
MFLDRASEAGQANARFIGNVLNAIETLRHFGSHSWMSLRFTMKAREVHDNWRAYVVQRVAYIAALGPGVALQFAVTSRLLPSKYKAGAVTIGDMRCLTRSYSNSICPFEMVARAIEHVARSRADLIPLARVWAAWQERWVSHTRDFVPSAGRLKFEGVGYFYEKGRGVTNVSFTATHGGITFLIGDTGCGKSTVFKPALKSMRILVDGTDLVGIDRADWYAAVAVVPQETTDPQPECVPSKQ